MKFGKCIIAVAFCLCLCGCGLIGSGSHIFVEGRHPQYNAGAAQNVSAKSYDELYAALVGMVENGVLKQTISVNDYDDEQLEADLKTVTSDVCQTNPIAAYAVEQIDCTIGTTGGMESLSVEITYLHDKYQIRRIVDVPDMASAKEAITQKLNACEAGVVLYIEAFEEVDFTQIVEDHAFAYPEYVMEQPQVTVGIYPESGVSRVVELKFTYNTSRESLKNMQTQVSTVFHSAVLYVSGDAAEEEKFSQLYSFLMERYDYTIEPSITPAYSLLRHGVGDGRAFATVYAAMCRQAGLECIVVSGGKEGGSWYWNIVCIDGVYYHVDLLSSNAEGDFRILCDNQLRDSGYVWDFDAYPECPVDVTEQPPISPVDPFEKN